MDALEAIMTRRSIRRFSDEPVTDEQIETIVRAAMQAPSAGNQRPWRFIVLRDRARLSEVSKTSPYAGMLAEAAFGLVVCSETEGLRHPMMWEQDCSAAVENALLAAHAMGLGAVWLGFHPKEERVQPLKDLLGLPRNIEPLAVLAVGVPAEHKEPADRYDPSLVHEDAW